MDISDLMKMIKGYERRFDIKTQFMYAEWRLIRWAGWAALKAGIPKFKLSPEKLYPLPEDRKDTPLITQAQLKKAFARHRKDMEKNQFTILKDG